MADKYIVVETHNHKRILEMLLPSGSYEIAVGVSKTSTSNYSARSFASSLKARNKAVALLLDTHSTVRTDIDPPSPGIWVVPAVPSLEIVFIYDRYLAEKVCGSELTNLEFQLAQSNPKLLVRTDLSQLTESDLDIARRHGIITSLREFLEVD